MDEMIDGGLPGFEANGDKLFKFARGLLFCLHVQSQSRPQIGDILRRLQFRYLGWPTVPRKLEGDSMGGRV